MSKSVKRKLTTLTLIEKAEIIKQLDQGKNVCNFAECYGIGRATQFTTKKKKKSLDKIVGFV